MSEERAPRMVEVGAVEDVPEGEARAFDVNGEPVAVVNLGGGEFRAVSDICSHERYYLSEGDVDLDDRTIECPKHGSTFDLDSGRPRTLPATKPVATYAVLVRDGRIMIEVEE